jgi:hypothetical protein
VALLAKDVLTTATAELLGADVAIMTTDWLQHLITLTQQATDLLFNELERRGELTFLGELPIVPDQSDYSVETILTRQD